MDAKKVRELQKASPFKPYKLILADGRSLPVERPSYLGISPNGSEISYAAVAGGFNFIPIAHVLDAVVDENLSTPWKRR
jgi:hypothetical protein